MNLKHLILPTVALGAAAGLLIPAKSDAYTLLGGALNTTQRDFRIFDNFTDAVSNDNVTPDANFPGYTGVELAIWKACTEWGSQLHAGSGNGDAHQNGGLGSGGANFDAVMQGNATSQGGTNSNQFSELAGSDGGTLAFCESPISDGWRIRFYSTWTWNDGPGTSITGIDIQGVATHEYGHALGLDHTNINGSTMLPGVFGNGVNSRSIGPDDIDGVQAIYGVVSATKPRINGISFSGGLLTLHGFNFDLVSNDVWFTPNTPGGSDVPVQVTGLPSNGSQITLAIPGTAGSGDVFVKLAGTQGVTLSNGWPIDVASIPAPPGFAYCFGDGSLVTPCPCALPDTVPSPSGASDAGCANSFNASGARLDAAGSKNPTDQVRLTVSFGTPAGFTFFISGNAADANGIANGDGVNCASGSFVRFGSQIPVNGASVYPNPALGLNTLLSTVGSSPVGSGQTRYYQAFYRNTTAGWCTPATSNVSSGYQMTWN